MCFEFFFLLKIIMKMLLGSRGSERKYLLYEEKKKNAVTRFVYTNVSENYYKIVKVRRKENVCYRKTEAEKGKDCVY